MDIDRAWAIVKTLNSEYKTLGSVECRKLLAEYMQLSVERPSKVHSALLSTAIKVAETYSNFRFMPFLQMWDLRNLRPEDREFQKSADGKTFPSLVDKVCKTFVGHRLLNPEEPLSEDQFAPLQPLLEERGYLPILPMVVTRIVETANKQGRKLRFVTLVSPKGRQVECVSSQLQPHPLHPLPEGKRHYVNVGQLYDVQLRGDKVHAAYLSSEKTEEVFPTAVGHVEHIDTEHGHIHIYDSLSRHFVSPLLRFSKEQEGDLVRFVPVAPSHSMFKTAVNLTRATIDEAITAGLIREIRIASVNEQKHFASWELVDTSRSITEQLSYYQLSQGQTSPSFTTGYLSLDDQNHPTVPVPDGFPSGITQGQTLQAVIFLKRGKDKLKRPHVAKIIN